MNFEKVITKLRSHFNPESNTTFHPIIQRMTGNCVSCGKQLMTNIPADPFISNFSDKCTKVENPVIRSGGILRCANCKNEVNSTDYCVHGTEYSVDCYYCPDDERLKNPNDLETRLQNDEEYFEFLSKRAAKYMKLE